MVNHPPNVEIRTNQVVLMVKIFSNTGHLTVFDHRNFCFIMYNVRRKDSHGLQQRIP